MQTRNRLLDDLARVASSALGVASGLREEAEDRLKHQFDRVLSDMDLVQREEFDAVRAMAVKAREQQEALAERVAALEAELAEVKKAAASKGQSRGAKGAASAKSTKSTSSAKSASARKTASGAKRKSPKGGS